MEESPSVPQKEQEQGPEQSPPADTVQKLGESSVKRALYPDQTDDLFWTT